MSSTFGGEQRLGAGGGRWCATRAAPWKVSISPKTRRSRQGEGRRGHQGPLPRRQHLVHAMAELVGEGNDVAGLALVVEQHVGVGRGHGRMGEGAGRLAGPDRGVDPALVEEAARDRGHGGGEAGIGVRTGPALVPADDPALDFGQGRIAVPNWSWSPRAIGPSRIIAMGEPRMGGLNGRDEGVDHLAFDVVGKVARVGDILGAAPAVGDVLVLGERVGDQGEEADVVARASGRSGLGARLAVLLVAADQQVEGRLEGSARGPRTVGFQRRHGLVEEAVPGVPAGERLLVEQLLDPVVELARPLLPQVLEPGPVTGERRHRQRPLELPVVDAVELQLEEDQPGGQVVEALVDVAIELLAGRVGGVADVMEAG